MQNNSVANIQGWLDGLEAEKQALLHEMSEGVNHLPTEEQNMKLEQLEALIFATQANQSLKRNRKARR